MPTVNFIHQDGTTQKIKAEVGASLMECARSQGVSGIEGECGGALSCATCHVYVDESWLTKLAPIEEIESDLLEATAAPRRGGSRLSCQITMSDALDGMTVFVPETQY